MMFRGHASLSSGVMCKLRFIPRHCLGDLRVCPLPHSSALLVPHFFFNVVKYL